MFLDLFIYSLIAAMFSIGLAVNIEYYRHRRSLTPEQRAAEDEEFGLDKNAW